MILWAEKAFNTAYAQVSFMAPTYSGRTITIDADYVNKNLSELAEDEDLTRYIL